MVAITQPDNGDEEVIRAEDLLHRPDRGEEREGPRKKYLDDPYIRASCCSITISVLKLRTISRVEWKFMAMWVSWVAS